MKKSQALTQGSQKYHYGLDIKNLEAEQTQNRKGNLSIIAVNAISPNCSFLEMLDILNEQLIRQNEEPVAFDHDCREGICGTCSLYINGRPHGPDDAVTTCQLHMRKFKDGDTIVIEPWRAKPFPVVKDLIVDRSAFDKIIQEGGYISVLYRRRCRSQPDPGQQGSMRNLSMDAAACIGCGACVAACKNASAMLFVSAKVSHLGLLPQGRIEAKDRVKKMVAMMDTMGFGNCTNTYACEAECPKLISRSNIARMNREFLCAKVS